jgi:hypothetical protein
MRLITCSQAEPLFADYLDGKVSNTDRLAMDAHLATCADCGGLAEDMRLAMRYMQASVEVEPPAELVSRILAQTTGLAPAGVPQWRHRLAGTWDSFKLLWVRPVVRPMLDPRFAMGLAMTVISCSMLLNLAGVDVRKVKLSDLQPVNLVHSAEHGVHNAGSWATKHYNNLRVVYEIQSQLQALREDTGTTSENPAPTQQPENKNGTQPQQQKQSAPAKKDNRSNSQRSARPITLAAAAIF